MIKIKNIRQEMFTQIEKSALKLPQNLSFDAKSLIKAVKLISNLNKKNLITYEFII